MPNLQKTWLLVNPSLVDGRTATVQSILVTRGIQSRIAIELAAARPYVTHAVGTIWLRQPLVSFQSGLSEDPIDAYLSSSSRSQESIIRNCCPN